MSINNDDSYEQDINLRRILASVRNNSKLIYLTTIIGLFFGASFILIKKPVWKGELQIVVAQDNRDPLSKLTQSLSTDDSILLGFINSNKKDNLKTQVEILKSPSVLLPVFDLVKKNKSREIKDIDNWSFVDWRRDNLNIELTKGTSVLNISYFDSSKTLIPEVLEKIGNQYKTYSKKDRLQSLNQGISYLKDQINLYKELSYNSLKEAQSFAIKNDLNTLKDIKFGDEQIINFIDIERIRIDASNRIRFIDQQLDLIDSIGNDPDTVMFVGRNIPELSESGIIKELSLVDTNLAFLKTKYQEDDRIIEEIKKRREVLIKSSKKQTIGFLKAKKTELLARKKAAERPKGTIIRYKELLRYAVRDEETLKNLENEFRLLSLEQARAENPWELITQPTLIDKPVSPKKKFTLVLGTFIGFIMGIVLSLFKNKDIIYEKEFVEKNLNLKQIELFNKKNIKNLNEILQLLKNNIDLMKKEKNLSIIYLSKIDNFYLDPLKKSLKTEFNNYKIIYTKNLNDNREGNLQIILCQIGKITKNELSDFKNKLNLLNKESLGIIFFE